MFTYNILQVSKKLQKGFSLIELMIVIAIIGILAAIGVPAYQDYLVRARVTEAMTVANSLKAAVSEYIVVKNAYPTSDALAGTASQTTAMVSSTSVAGNGNIAIVVNATAAGMAAASTLTLTLSPIYNTSTGVITWTCKSTGNVKYAPTSCRN